MDKPHEFPLGGIAALMVVLAIGCGVIYQGHQSNLLREAAQKLKKAKSEMTDLLASEENFNEASSVSDPWGTLYQTTPATVCYSECRTR